MLEATTMAAMARIPGRRERDIQMFRFGKVAETWFPLIGNGLAKP
jgi:hypothetical protein